MIPCLNEAETSAVVAAAAALASNGIEGEVIVVDNGSDDGSGALAEAAGARVIFEPRRGYGQRLSDRSRRRPGRVHPDGRRRPDVRLR